MRNKKSELAKESNNSVEYRYLDGSKMKELENLQSLLRDEKSFDIDVLAGAFENQSKLNRRFKLSVIIFTSNNSPIELFNCWHSKHFAFNIKEFNGFYVINLNRTIKRTSVEGDERAIIGSFGIYRYGESNIWIAFTSESPYFFENGVIRFIESYKPDISRIYLSSEELRSVFEKVEACSLGEIYVKKAVLYSHINEGQISFKKAYFQELFNAAENESSYVDKVEYDIRQNDEPSYHGFISRSLISYYYSGKINNFFNQILPILVSISKDKLEVFENKARKYHDIEAKPLHIKFPQDVFNDKYDNIRLIEALEKVSYGAVAIYHKNPYLHVSFLDFVDGSNFDIFVTNSNKMSIIPNYKCSMYSLMRVTDQIFKDFKEGKIEIAEKRKYSFSDFIGE